MFGIWKFLFGYSDVKQIIEYICFKLNEMIEKVKVDIEEELGQRIQYFDIQCLGRKNEVVKMFQIVVQEEIR